MSLAALPDPTPAAEDWGLLALRTRYWHLAQDGLLAANSTLAAGRFGYATVLRREWGAS